MREFKSLQSGCGVKMDAKTKLGGFTLVELLVVIAIIGILAAIIVPVAGGAKSTAQKRRALVEMNSIKVSVLRFYDDHHYMPWGDPKDMMTTEKVGADGLTWTGSGSVAQENMMKWLTGDNPMRESYLQIPAKSRQNSAHPMLFTDPWGQEYRVGVDRDMDGRVLLANTDVPGWDGKTVKEKVLVWTPGIPGRNNPLATFDVID